MALAYPYPLTLVTSLGEKLTAPDIPDQIVTGLEISNVGPYDLQEVIPVLRPEIPIRLILIPQSHPPTSLSVPSLVLQEWSTVADRSIT